MIDWEGLGLQKDTPCTAQFRSDLKEYGMDHIRMRNDRVT